MEFLLWFTQMPERPYGEGMAEMTKFSAELVAQGKLRCGAPLRAQGDGARLRVRDGKALITDGPFAESREVAGGFWILEVGSREEALEIARRAPHAGYGYVEVHGVRFRETAPERGDGADRPFLCIFYREPGLVDPDGSKLNEMMAFGRELEKDGKLTQIAPLASDPPPARLEPRAGKPWVTDGPFAESKETIGGYAVIHAANRAEAIATAARFPHARWGLVEVREILFFDPA